MRAIFIDTNNRTVEEFNHNGDYQDIQKKIGCDCFTCVGLENGETVYVNDNGLYEEDNFFFMPDAYPTPLAGNAVILGCDMNTGESRDTALDVDEIANKVEFASKEVIAFMSKLGVF